jgi:hypothetical protein
LYYIRKCGGAHFVIQSTYQKRTILKLCFDGFTVQNQKLTPIWTPVFDVVMDLQVSKLNPPQDPDNGSKSLANSKVLTWKSGGADGTRTRNLFRDREAI